MRNWNVDGWKESDWEKIGNVAGLLITVAADLDDAYGGGGGGCTPSDLDSFVEYLESALRRLKEVRQGYL